MQSESAATTGYPAGGEPVVSATRSVPRLEWTDDSGPRTATGEERHTAGVDFSLATSRFRGSQNLEMIGWFLHASRPGISKGNSSFGAVVDYPNDRWVAKFETTEVQEGFDPAVGFVRRLSYRRYAPQVGFQPRPANSFVRQFRFGVTVDTIRLSCPVLM